MIKVDGSNNYTEIFEGNQTKWNSETGEGYVAIDHHDFTLNKEYFWKVAVQYEYRSAVVWSQYSDVYRSQFSGKVLILHMYMSASDCPGRSRNFNINSNGQQIVRSITMCKH